ncbi:MAG: hypothetical protein V4574_03805 [Pseudomonadota bacterium]
MIALAAFVWQTQAAVFAPPLGVPIRIVTERSQGTGAGRFAVRIERLVRFARDGIGYRAEVVLLSADTGTANDARAMLQAGFAGLAGRTMVFRLDGAGKVVAVDDRAALWERFCASIAAAVVAQRVNGTPAEHAALAERMAGPLRALPADRQQALLGSLVSALIADAPEAAPGTRPIRLPGASPFGGPVTLEGTRSVAPAGDLRRTATRATAAVPAQDGAAGRVELEIDDDMDPRTGLVAAHTETLRSAIGEGPAARRTERVTTVTVTLEPGRIWPG